MTGDNVGHLLRDLADEEAELATTLRGLQPAEWDAPTPAAGWTVRDQVAHLATGEELATMAVNDPPGFAARLQVLLGDLAAVEEEQSRRAGEFDPPRLLEWWIEAGGATIAALRDHPPGRRIVWITGPMSAASFVTARLMETWAHGTDVAAAVGVATVATDRLRHVADLGVRTRAFSFRNRQLAVPSPEPFVELTGPGGELWSWGTPGAADHIAGPALDFCLVVCRRRHPSATALRVVGSGALAWMEIAQCFAGPPSENPPPVK